MLPPVCPHSAVLGRESQHNHRPPPDLCEGIVQSDPAQLSWVFRQSPWMQISRNDQVVPFCL